MTEDKLVASLHPLERKVLPVLEQNTELSKIAEAAKLKEVEAMRALQWLENKGILEIKTEVNELVELDKNGDLYLEEGFPEKKFLELIKEGPKTASDLIKGGLDKAELNSLIGLLKMKNMITIGKTTELVFTINVAGSEAISKELPPEALLKKLPANINDLNDSDLLTLKALLKRKDIVKVEKKRIKTIILTALGKKIIKQDLSAEGIVDSITPKILKEESWKDKKFRRYDVKINVPAVHGGKRHFVTQATDYAKRIWLDLGFKEMEGQIVNTSFWNFDALFTAQDHPVRDMQDTFFIEDPVKGKLPNLELVKAVKEMHETGGNIPSSGWMYKWKENEAMLNVLRTHTTVLSAKTLAKLKETDLPAKFFSIGKCFRNEAVDWSHGFEFNQTDGIVIDPNANFRHLLGYLKEFFKKMGFPKARFRPAYFPYTEPSVEIDVFHPVHKEWLELGGAGMFRPEVIVPLLGKNIPVLAWGPGFDRLILEYYKINDIRDLHKNDLKQIREMKYWMR